EAVNCTKFWALWLVGGLALGCSASGADKGKNGGTGASSTGATSHGGSSTTGPDLNLGGATPGDPTGGDDNNPTTCVQAEKSQTYIGCDFWPTITYNPVYHEFAFAVVLANGGPADADVTIERAGMMVATDKVPAGGLTTIKLPWVMELKGDEF